MLKITEKSFFSTSIPKPIVEFVGIGNDIFSNWLSAESIWMLFPKAYMYGYCSQFGARVIWSIRKKQYISGYIKPRWFIRVWHLCTFWKHFPKMKSYKYFHDNKQEFGEMFAM